MEAIQNSAKSSAEQFSALVARHRGIVRKVATTYCRDANDRADLAQEITARLWQSWPHYDQERPFSTWMYRVALNVAITHVRGVYRHERHHVALGPDHEQIPDTPVDHEANELLAILRNLIDNLDGLNRALLLLYLEDRSHREIADILGIGESNVGTKIGRLKERLRAQLAQPTEGQE
jgi:RNA polymerase sigma-70 factor (ECF subfamily)